MTRHWVDDLSDDELLQRLVAVGMPAADALRMVGHRDSDAVHSYIRDLLEAGR